MLLVREVLKITPPIDFCLDDILKYTLNVNPKAIDIMDSTVSHEHAKLYRKNSLAEAKSILEYLAYKKMKNLNKSSANLGPINDSEHKITDLAELLRDEDKLIKEIRDIVGKDFVKQIKHVNKEFLSTNEGFFCPKYQY